MESLQIITPILLTIGQTLGVGASTFALLFYIMATQDGVIDSSEKRFMRAVYVVLRIGMAIIATALVLKYLAGTATTPIYLMQLTLLGIITLNAFLMSKRLISMRIGPVLAGGSWYSLFFLSVLPPITFAFSILLFGYILSLVFFFIVFSVIKKRYSQ